MQTATSKKWIKSKTVWGIFIAFIGWLAQTKLQVSDLQIPANPDFDQLKNYAQAIKESNGSMAVIFAQVTSLIGYLVALYGRIVANEKITL
ncbi:hypothetical protein UFOVP579_51 [uncultured Caudovirales phage]|uniref:Uncharacterized protein n=1 Tax=uncultured Caudovirales phage TaxID=2100421 RepID=A0A6J5PCA7_9CAUD|nr:hypothetical protein UFOVP302_51 [uncultured Caudovirales phage]CAB4168762.1 hypothetical protein UFOVP579_51 [uncultured Caudovirales phage]